MHRPKGRPGRVRPKRAFIIHGYLSYPEEAWLPWLKAELTKRGYVVALPSMPHPDRPVISEWIGFIANLVGQPDKKTVMIGHSLGCQAVLRYLETLGAAGQSVRRTVLVAGAFPAGMPAAEVAKRTRGRPALRPWFATAVDSNLVKKAAGKCTVILSSDDPFIPVKRAQAVFLTRLGAEVIIEHGKGHFNEDDEVTELPAALRAIVARPP